MNPERIVKSGMYEHDAFSKWLGIQIGNVSYGSCEISMVVRSEMVNGFGIAHGGITYSLADSALAFAANSLGKKAVSINTKIMHTLPVNVGDHLTAIAKPIHKGNKISHFSVEINNQLDEKVAHFEGSVYAGREEW